jgi:hypothetical protein
LHHLAGALLLEDVSRTKMGQRWLSVPLIDG